MKLINKLLLVSLFVCTGIQAILSQSPDEYKNRGFFHISKFSLHSTHRVDEGYFEPGVGSFQLNVRKNNSMAFGLQSINGWFIFPFLSAGLGVGYDYYNSPEFRTFPVYLDIRAYFSNSRNSFYVNFDIGTLLNFEKKYSNGQVVNAGIGYKFFATEKLCLLFGISANSKMFNLSGYPSPSPSHDFTVNSIAFDLGVLF